MRSHSAACALLLALLALPAFAQEARAPTGLVATATVEGTVAVNGPLRFRLEVCNEGAAPLSFGATNRLFGLLTLKPDHGRPYLSEMIPLAPAAAWPTALKPGASCALEPVDVGQVTARLAVTRPDAFMRTLRNSDKIGALLTPGTVRFRWCVSVPRPGGAPPLHFLTDWQEVGVAAAAPSAAATNASPNHADLLSKFNRDAWSAQQAHDAAVKLGAPLLPELIAAAQERARPDFARMWLATAVADIPGEPAVAALTALLDDPAGEVRCVVAYHGPKQKSAALDQAILATAQKSNSAHFTAYALLGFLAFRGEAPEALRNAGVESDDPRARATAADVLATMASEQDKARLQALLQDRDERVRAAAKRVLEAMQAAKPAAAATP